MNTYKKRLIASTLIAGALSLGTAGLATVAAGSASADVPYRDCSVQAYANCHHPWAGPTLPGPYYP